MVGSAMKSLFAFLAMSMMHHVHDAAVSMVGRNFTEGTLLKVCSNASSRSQPVPHPHPTPPRPRPVHKLPIYVHAQNVCVHTEMIINWDTQQGHFRNKLLLLIPLAWNFKAKPQTAGGRNQLVSVERICEISIVCSSVVQGRG